MRRNRNNYRRRYRRNASVKVKILDAIVIEGHYNGQEGRSIYPEIIWFVAINDELYLLRNAPTGIEEEEYSIYPRAEAMAARYNLRWDKRASLKTPWQGEKGVRNGQSYHTGKPFYPNLSSSEIVRTHDSYDASDYGLDSESGWESKLGAVFESEGLTKAALVKNEPFSFMYSHDWVYADDILKMIVFTIKPNALPDDPLWDEVAIQITNYIPHFAIIEEDYGFRTDFDLVAEIPFDLKFLTEEYEEDAIEIEQEEREA